jgi:hypothetical protein
MKKYFGLHLVVLLFLAFVQSLLNLPLYIYFFIICLYVLIAVLFIEKSGIKSAIQLILVVAILLIVDILFLK